MEQATQTTTDTAVTEVASKPAKAPSKKAQGKIIFNEEMVKLLSKEHKSNKDFRQAVIRRMESELGLSTASAATNYNTAKIEAEAAAVAAGSDFKLGRDPKVEKPAKEKKAKKAKVIPATTEASADTPALDTTAIDAPASEAEIAQVATTESTETI